MHCHFTHILFLTLLLISGGSIAQQPTPLAVINDPDGFTHVRKGQSATSLILVTLHKDQLFAVHPGKGDWWKVEYATWRINAVFGDKEGYIHKSRVHLLNDMADSARRGILCRTLSAVRQEFKHANRLSEEAHRTSDKVKSQKLLDNASHTRTRAFDATYEAVLEELAAYIIRSGDTIVLHEWLLVYIDTEGSSSEWPSEALAICFTGARDLVMDAIRSFPPKQRKILYGHIYFGLTNLDSDNRTDIQRLETLMKSDGGMK